MRYRFLLSGLLLCSALLAKSQAVPKGTEAQELVKIADVYANTPALQFVMRYAYADTVRPAVLTDSTSVYCTISNGSSFLVEADSTWELLRTRDYDVFVSREDSMVAVNRKIVQESIFQMPLLDSMFVNANVTDMNITAYNDSLWRFRVSFKPYSHYSFFDMYYDPQTGLVSSISYCMRNLYGEHNLNPGSMVITTITMQRYSAADTDPALFNERRYFYELNGALYLQPAWNGYQLQTF